MKYGKALDIGRARAEQAAKALTRWTGAAAYPVCAVKPAYGTDPLTARTWKPVGRESLKEIARDDGTRGGGRYHLLVVDERGAVKACSRDRLPLAEALRLVERLPLRVTMPGQGELWRLLQEENLSEDAREHGLHVEV